VLPQFFKQQPQFVPPVAWGENEPDHNSFEGTAKTQGWYQWLS